MIAGAASAWRRCWTALALAGAEAGNIEDVAADAAGNIYAGLAEPRVLRRLLRR